MSFYLSWPPSTSVFPAWERARLRGKAVVPTQGACISPLLCVPCPLTPVSLFAGYALGRFSAQVLLFVPHTRGDAAGRGGGPSSLRVQSP